MTPTNKPSNIAKYYLASILSGVTLSIPIRIIYYQSFGLSFYEIGLLESIFLVTTLIFELPTGALADKWGRKFSVVFGSLLMPLGSLLIALGSSFSVFALSSVIYGIGAAFISGAESALVYDSLLDTEEERHFIRIEGRAYALLFAASALSAPIGSYLYASYHRAPFYVDTLFAVLTLFIYATMTESKQQAAEKKESYWSILRHGLTYSVRHSTVLWLIMYVSLVSSTMSAFHHIGGQPILSERGLSIQYFGYAFAAFLLVEAIFSEKAHIIEKRIGETRSLFLTAIVPAVAFLGISLIPSLAFALVSFVFFNACRGFFHPVLQSYIQNHTESKIRATVLSTESFVSAIAGAIFLPIFGKISDGTSLSSGILFLAIIMGVGSVLLMLVKPQITITGLQPNLIQSTGEAKKENQLL